eukprot:15908-Heterococcus_DN1.PRE.1
MRLGKENNLIRDGEALNPHHVTSADSAQQQQQRAGKPVLCAQTHCKHVTANRLGKLLSTEHDSLAHVRLSRERHASKSYLVKGRRKHNVVMIQPTLDSIKAKVEKVFAECQREDYEILYNNAVVDCDEALYELCADPETLTLSVHTYRMPVLLRRICTA